MTTAAPTVNREAVRVLAIAVGVREAARRMGLSVERVMKWSQRGNWLMSADASALATPSATGATAQLERCPQPVRNAGDALQSTLLELGNRSKLAHAKAGAKAAEHMQTLDGEAIVSIAQQRKAIIDGDKLIHGWDKQEPAVVNLQLGFFGGDVR